MQARARPGAFTLDERLRLHEWDNERYLRIMKRLLWYLGSLFLFVGLWGLWQRLEGPQAIGGPALISALVVPAAAVALGALLFFLGFRAAPMALLSHEALRTYTRSLLGRPREFIHPLREVAALIVARETGYLRCLARDRSGRRWQAYLWDPQGDIVLLLMELTKPFGVRIVRDELASVVPGTA